MADQKTVTGLKKNTQNYPEIYLKAIEVFCLFNINSSIDPIQITNWAEADVLERGKSQGR